MNENFSSTFYILSMMYETLQRMKDLLIGRHIYINLHQDHEKKSKLFRILSCSQGSAQAAQI